MEVGGLPQYTLTEDFAMGMELKMLGWQCRYVRENLAVGEAPTEIRNCFQQRSRWIKVMVLPPSGLCPWAAATIVRMLLGRQQNPPSQLYLRLFGYVRPCSSHEQYCCMCLWEAAVL